ncbi:unnamed protein product [Cercopithifilaria johnstoni]|uniref:Uncharacterized protein n=1 Tax=Cercopithifilaria johnstoni TaxID=2874296 RepID=A0A8J2M3N1_9BILA|nr:unnamed protein product [Cercopithifilaria johnstoni]
MDLTGILDLSRSEKPTALMNRLRKFLPEIATANTNLGSATECDIEIIAVEDGSDASSSTDSDNESEAKTNQLHVVMDVTTVREDAPIRVVISGSDSDFDDEGQQVLPVGFRTKEPVRKKRRKGDRQRLVEEVSEEYMASKEISNDKEISAESKRIEQ